MSKLYLDQDHMVYIIYQSAFALESDTYKYKFNRFKIKLFNFLMLFTKEFINRKKTFIEFLSELKQN